MPNTTRGNIFRVGFFAALIFGSAIFLSGCNIGVATVNPVSTASPGQTITLRTKATVLSRFGGAVYGLAAILLPNDWEVVTSSYYLPTYYEYPTDVAMVSSSDWVSGTNLPAAPDGYHWYTARTPGVLNFGEGQEIDGVAQVAVGSATGTYNLEYWVGDYDDYFTASTTHSIEVRTDPCADTTFSDGDSDGYLDVSTVCQLRNLVTNSTTAYYELTDDIDFDADNNPEMLTGSGFAPIGVSTSPFRGRFNGNNHTISGLYIYRPETDYVGLFGYVTGGAISNVNLVDADVKGRGRVGALVGRLYVGGTVSGSSATGNIVGEYYVGGLVGGAVGAISNSRTNVNVTGTMDFVGGLVGGSLSTISGSYSTGRVVAIYYTNEKASFGGLAGVLDTTGRISNCSSSADVEGRWAGGGLVGSSLGDITNSFATGNVTTSDYYSGGLVGSLSGNVSSSYATGRVYGSGSVGGLVGVSDSAPSSKGGIYDSYAIGTVDNTNGGEWNGGLVGGTSGLVSNSFASGYVNSAGNKTGGLVGGLSGRVTLSSSTGDVYGSNMTGGLIGYANSSATVDNSFATGNVTSTQAYVGGLIGRSEGVISHASSTGAVVNHGNYSYSYAGGLIGSQEGGSIIDSHSTGAVEGYNTVGGLVGYLYNSLVSSTYAIGDVGVAYYDGTYHLSQQIDGQWVEKYQKSFFAKYSNADFNFTPIDHQLKLQINQNHLPYADIDQIKLTACGQTVAPAYARYADGGQSVLDDILSIDDNVALNHEKPIEIAWNIPESCDAQATVSLFANEYGVGAPVYFGGKYRMGDHTGYRPFWVSNSGHPDGYTYIDITSDASNVYFNLDVTGDNTDESGVDWTEIAVGKQVFRIDDNTDTWGKCTFGLSDKVAYKHQMCRFVIAKNLLPTQFNFGLRYYGTYSTGGAGGLVGVAQASVIDQSYATGDMTTSYYSAKNGGLIGDSAGNTISNVYATGDVISDYRYIGGLIGYNYANIPASITNAYATGNVTGTEYIGGLIGFNDQDDVQNSFAVGEVIGTDEATYGALIGYDNSADPNLYTKNYWYNSLSAGISNLPSSTASGQWEKAASASTFQGDSTAAPFKVGDTQYWDTDIWAFPEGSYPQLQVFYGSWTPSCHTVSHAATYNSYPTCGAATCDSGYDLSNGTCTLHQSGGGGSVSLPPGIGPGTRDSTITGDAVGGTVNVGAVTTDGVNVLTYITSNNNFTAPESSNNWTPGGHNFVITALDLSNQTATVTFHSNPVTITLKKGESKDVDLDSDKTPDIRATFVNTYVNRAEITVKSLAKAPAIKTTHVDNTNGSSGFTFTRLLKQGMKGEDVKQLQIWLNNHNFTITTNGAGSPGKETTLFGPATKKALIKMQKQYQLKPYPGYTGPGTRQILNENL